MIQLKEIAERVKGILVGDGNVTISGVASIASARAGDITFLTHGSFEKHLTQCHASAIIVGEGTATEAIQGKNAIVVQNPSLAYALVAELFAAPAAREKGISLLAHVAADAEVSAEASVYPYVYIGSRAVVARNVTIHPFVFIGDGVKIGEGSTIYPNVTIYNDVLIGERVILHAGVVLGSDGFGYVWDGQRHKKITQLGTLIVGNDVEIGANSAIDRASLDSTVIQAGVKIDNLVQIGHNVSIGENSIIVSQVGIAGSSTVGRNVILAGQVGVADHVTIGDMVKAAGGTGITKSVPANETIAGTPHMPHKEWARLQGYLKRLPALFQKMKRVEEKLHLEDDHGRN